MSELFKVNTPLPAQEANRIRPQGPTQAQVTVQQVPDPTRVTQPPQQNNINADREANRFLPNFESNYDKFIKLLRASPNAASAYETLFFTRMENVVSSGISEGLAVEMAEYMELLQMTEAELFDLIKSQLQNAVKFQGPFFNILRQIFNQTLSGDLQYSVLEMLRNYDSMTSSQHILEQILSNLQNIAERLPEGRAAELREMIEMLMKEHANGQNQLNVNIMKNTILPFLSQYIAERGDYGVFRDLATMFTLDLVRYESGSLENFLQSFRRLMTFEDVATAFRGADIGELEQYMINSRYPNHKLIDKFVSVLSRGLSGESGLINRPVFENILQSMLINESVYMPLLHAVIPADVFGNLFYGEMWVDPDSDEGSEGSSGGEARGIKILMKFDVKSVGYFEMIMLSRENAVDMQLFYPENLESARGEIRTAIGEIMSRNGLSVSNFSLGQLTVPKNVSEVFPKIYERKNSINVLI
ncbi:MAG: hypothetical protein FWE66_01425 [Oscillospiraceae bacterium]|nr:hypothetical protein [Oscillospiraceae bacterium]